MMEKTKICDKCGEIMYQRTLLFSSNLKWWKCSVCNNVEEIKKKKEELKIWQ